MAISIENAGGRRRALDAVVNLVPFIDLLSCCLAFLLITAVWSQSAQLGAHTLGDGGESEGEPARPWTLLVGPEGCTLRAPSGELESVAEGELPARLRARAVGEELIVIGAERVPYAAWIRALDEARSAGVVRLDVSLSG